jgi:hypothetical protein
MENTPKNLNRAKTNTGRKKLQQLQMKADKINGGNKMVASKYRTRNVLHIGVKH